MNDLIKKDKKNIWHPFTPLTDGADPIEIQSAQGIYLHAADGRGIIDAISSWWVNLHGHANPNIAKAIAEQALKLEHVIFAGFTHEPAVRLSENILQILPENQSRIFFSDNGSTAVEVAIKMVLQYWHNLGIPKKKIIALSGAYHGDTFGAMSVGDRGIFTTPFQSHLFDVEFIDFPFQEKENTTLHQFEDYIKNKDVAAFIFEPLVQAASGMRMYRAEVLDQLMTLAERYDVRCIADEVFTGFGRTGNFFASDYLKNKPDVIALSKGLTGGTMPLGVTSCSERITNAYKDSDFLKTFFHGHSYTANPLACAASNASFDILTSQLCQDNIQRISLKHEEFKTKIMADDSIKEIRNLGTILAIELKNADPTSYVNPIRKKIYNFFLERNILLRPLGNVIYVLPPYIITNDELDIIYKAIKEFIEESKKY